MGRGGGPDNRSMGRKEGRKEGRKANFPYILVGEHFINSFPGILEIFVEDGEDRREGGKEERER